MKRAASVNCDVIIDDQKFIIETTAELETFIRAAQRHKGINFNAVPRDIAIRLWSQMEDEEQKRFERGKLAKSLSLNFNAMRAMAKRGA